MKIQLSSITCIKKVNKYKINKKKEIGRLSAVRSELGRRRTSRFSSIMTLQRYVTNFNDHVDYSNQSSDPRHDIITSHLKIEFIICPQLSTNRCLYVHE